MNNVNNPSLLGHSTFTCLNTNTGETTTYANGLDASYHLGKSYPSIRDGLAAIMKKGGEYHLDEFVLTATKL